MDNPLIDCVQPVLHQAGNLQECESAVAQC